MGARGKVILVTGAARNIGFHVAKALVGRGAKVAIVARSGDALAEAARTLGNGTLAVVADVTDPAQIGNAIERTVAEFGGIDGIVNNAGVAFPNAIEKLATDEVKAQTAVNFLAPVYAARAIIPHLRARGGGRIVNISSATTRVPGSFGHLSIYSATKAALEHFTEHLRHEVQKDNIAVTCFIPGDTHTGFGRNWNEEAARAGFEDWLTYGPSCNGMLGVETMAEEIAHMFDLPDNVAYEVVMLRPVGLFPKVMEGE